MSYRKSAYGIGVNDADYQVTTYEVVDGRRKRRWCPFYAAWIDMLTRSYSCKYHERFPTYAECAVAPEWHSFMVFRSWMQDKDWKGKQLDKDILVPGNKMYSPDTCVFISGALNTFLVDCGSRRGEFPTGVSLCKKNGRFLSQCHNPFNCKQEYLGYFTSPNAAREAYLKRKHGHACAYADQQTDQRIAQALRVRFCTKP